MTSCWRTRPFPWPLELWRYYNMVSLRGRMSKSFASLPCILWCWQHWKVLSYTIGKTTWLQTYMKTNKDVISSLQKLSMADGVTETILTSLGSFVCAAFSPKGIYIKTIPELRWHLFCKHLAESDKLPPTLGALRQHVLRVHIQARIWGQASIAMQDQEVDLMQNGYHKDSHDQMKPTMTDALPTPMAIIEMVSCKCKTDCSTARCSCRTNNLSCTDLCQCSSECQNDEDTQNTCETDDDVACEDV